MVEVIEPTGSETQLEVSLHGHRLTVVLHEQLDIRRGETVPLLPDVDKILFFERRVREAPGVGQVALIYQSTVILAQAA